ncbi:hypothetical protein [Nocardia asteroides]|uniref:hypothetical protein n=1 Tax=Nocardia asteroides TaxID=1824 RepID=UPI0033F0E36B
MTVSAPLAPEKLAALRRDLVRTGELFQQLDVTITRTDAIGPRGDGVTGGGHDQPLPINDRASEARRRLALQLRHTAAVPPWSARALTPHGAALAILQRVPLTGAVPVWVHGEVGKLLDAYTAAWGAIDAPGQRRIVGHCANAACGAVLYAPAHLDVMRCARCGHEHPARAVRSLMTEAAAEYQGTAAELASLLPHYYGEKVQAATIRQWHHRGHLMGCLYPDGRTLYRVGDVLALHRVAQAGRRR